MDGFHNMKLVLLPGLDGTGSLFDPFISHLHGIDTQIIPLPMVGDQSYETLTSYVASQLPDEPFTLLAESFSGPIAANLISTGQYQTSRVIFVATFLTPPRRIFLNLVKYVPLKRLMHMPFSDYFIKTFLLGFHSDTSILNLFKHVIDHVPNSIVKSRLSSISNLQPMQFKSSLDAIYILPDNDVLVPRQCLDAFKNVFPKIKSININGPHFIMQTRPEECAVQLKSYLR